MAIDVRSEVRPLKKVLLQRPGRELEQLVPNSMERLLFDDIPYLRGAQTEHDRFAQVLRDSGVIWQRPQGRENMISLRRDDLDARFPGLMAILLQTK